MLGLAIRLVVVVIWSIQLARWWLLLWHYICHGFQDHAKGMDTGCIKNIKEKNMYTSVVLITLPSWHCKFCPGSVHDVIGYRCFMFG